METMFSLSEQEKLALSKLQEDFKSQQDSNWEPYPNLYVLVNYEEMILDYEYSNLDGRFAYIHNEGEIGDVDHLKEYLECNYPEDLKTFLEEYQEEYDEKFDWKDMDGDSYLEAFLTSLDIWNVYIAKIQKDEQVFLTKESAEQHLKNNHYHYHKDAFIDRRKPWRNPIMETLLNLLYRVGIPEVEDNGCVDSDDQKFSE